MSTRSNIDNLGGDDDNQKQTPPSKPRPPFPQIASEGLPVGVVGALEGGGGDRVEQKRVIVEKTVADASGLISVIFDVASSITFSTDAGDVTDTYVVN